MPYSINLPYGRPLALGHLLVYIMTSFRPPVHCPKPLYFLLWIIFPKQPRNCLFCWPEYILEKLLSKSKTFLQIYSIIQIQMWLVFGQSLTVKQPWNEVFYSSNSLHEQVWFQFFCPLRERHAKCWVIWKLATFVFTPVCRT